MPFWNLYLEQHLGFSAAQIGYLSALVLATKMIGPYIWGWLADYYGLRIRIIRLGSWLAFVSFLAVFWRQDFWTLFAIITVYSFFWNAVLSQFEVITLAHLRHHSDRYSQVRLWGSIGFIAAVASLGLLFDHADIRYLPPVLAVLLLGIFVASMLVREPVAQCREKPQSHMALFWQQLKKPGIAVFFLACFLVQFSHGPYYTFYTIYLESLGYARVLIGSLWSLGVAAEVVVFLLMHRFLARFSLRYLLLITLAITVCRWLLIAGFADYLSLLILAQLMHAASFGSFHAVAIEVVRKNFSDASSGQAQAFYSAVSFGAGGATGALLSGWLWGAGAFWMFLLAALAAMLAFIAVWLFVRQ